MSKQSFKKILLACAAMGIVVSMGSGAHAQSDPYDPSSPNYVGNKSTAKAPKYNINLSATAFRGFDEFAEEGAFYQAVVGFKATKKLRADVTVGYSHPFDFDAERTDRWEFEDVTMRLLNPSMWKSESKAQNFALIGSVSLPTSGASVDSGQYTSARLTGRYTYRQGKLTYALSPSLIGAYHDFDTADEDGNEKNTPLGAAVGGSIRYGITSKLGVVAAASITTLFDYDFNNTNVQSLSASVQYSINKKMFMSLGARWRDRVITNNATFDDDASAASLTLGYTL